MLYRRPAYDVCGAQPQRHAMLRATDCGPGPEHLESGGGLGKVTAKGSYEQMAEARQRLLELLHYHQHRLEYRKRTEIAVEIVRQLEDEGSFPQVHYALDKGVLTFDETWRAEGEVEEPAIAGRRPGEAGDASRRIVIVGAVSHRIGVRRGGRRTNRGVITCRVMRVHFGDTMAEMHHEHSDTPGYFLANLCVPGSDR